MRAAGVVTLRAVVDHAAFHHAAEVQEVAEELFSKRLLVEISHAIERFALAAPMDEPLIVIAMFQKLSYFEREAAIYRDIAGRRAVTVVGLAENFPPRLPPDVRHCLLDPADPLAREWSVTVLGPRGGATLIAVDQETVDVTAQTLEEGRSFRGRWSFRREHA
jgi:DICT domain-containing protein